MPPGLEGLDNWLLSGLRWSQSKTEGDNKANQAQDAQQTTDCVS